MSAPEVLLVAAPERAPASKALLDAGEIPCDVATFPGPPDSQLSAFRLAVVDSGGQVASANAFARRWRLQTRRPLLWLADDVPGRAAGWRSGADMCLAPPMELAELRAQVQTLLELHAEREHLAIRAADSASLADLLHRHCQQLEIDTRLARILQRQLQPAALPELGRIRLAVSQRSQTHCGGDFYDCWTVDESCVAFCLGDVLGHTLTSCLLAIGLNWFVRSGGLRADAPADVLAGANEMLLRLELPEPPLARMAFGVVDVDAGTLRFASAAHPAPLLLPREDAPRFVPAHGSLLGVVGGGYRAEACALQPGDRLVFYSDGLMDPAVVAPAALADAAHTHRGAPLPAFAEAVAQTLVEDSVDPDDFTLLAVEAGETAGRK